MVGDGIVVVGLTVGGSVGGIVAITTSISTLSSSFFFNSSAIIISDSLPLVVSVTDELNVLLAISITSAVPFPISIHQISITSITHQYQFFCFTKTSFFQCDVLNNRQINQIDHSHIRE